MRLFHELGRALLDAGSMTWQITWSLILGFTLSAVIQAVVRREAIARHLGTSSTRTLALATGLGAASSSCSYAAVALARALVRRGGVIAFIFARDHSEVLPHRGARPAPQSLQA